VRSVITTDQEEQEIIRNLEIDRKRALKRRDLIVALKGGREVAEEK
jgi:hypothetical protein